MMRMTGARAVLECLKREGVDVVFGYPGGAILPLYEEMYKDNYCVVGDYDELKRQMEMNGFWNDKIEFWMENFCRFHNNLT